MADALRGSMATMVSKHVPLGLIFLKYISDAFEERHAAALAEFAADAAEDRDEYTTENIYCIRLAGDSSTNTGRNSRNGLGTLEVPNGNGAVNCIGSIGASPLRVTIPAWVGRS